MARPKRFRLVIDFNSIEDLMAWAEGTENMIHLRQGRRIASGSPSRNCHRDAPSVYGVPVDQSVIWISCAVFLLPHAPTLRNVRTDPGEEHQ